MVLLTKNNYTYNYKRRYIYSHWTSKLSLDRQNLALYLFAPHRKCILQCEINTIYSRPKIDLIVFTYCMQFLCNTTNTQTLCYRVN